MANPSPDLVLVVEDDPAMMKVVSAALRNRGYGVVEAVNGEAALRAAEQEKIDVILLDLGLPDIDGIDICRRVRGWSNVPIIVVTVDAADRRKVTALDGGADDYVTKPFSMPELLARIRVALRHRRAGHLADQPIIEVGDLRIDIPSHLVTVAGSTVDLTPTEFSLLALLARHAGTVLTHRALLEGVWGREAANETQYLRVFTGQLRKKLRDDPDRPRLLTEPGVGYRLVDPDTDPR